MAVEFGELRPEDMSTAQELLNAQGEPAGGLEHLPLVLGLGAREGPGGRIIGAIFIRRDQDHGYVNTLGVDPDHEAGDLPRQLLAKAMGKLYSRGVRRCHLTSNDTPRGDDFWDLLRWSGQRPDAQPQPQPA